ncbi:MAG TPA: exosortase B [Albitalea sp.]|uniref:exosortase B n=1 Tax=Piscinibacter sp. TaxID=1903157 RepID=UPI002ED4E1FA
MPRSLAMPTASREHLPWLIALAGFALMFGPVYWNAATGIWQTDDNAHGPIIALVLLYLFWSVWRDIVGAEERPLPSLGWPLFGLGLLMYVFGRAFNISSVEFAAQLPVVAAALLLIKGPAALRAAWFPVFYLVFMIPLPGSLVDAVTGPLKQWISDIVEAILWHAGYPISRSGVVLQIGQYQLLVADACSGLHSMFSLSALGTLFMYLMARRSRLHNVIMLAAILPVAFIANIVRVIVLVLVTYHLGDEAGQGFLHDTAGIVLMIVALCILFLVDALLRLVLRERPARA